MIFAILISFLKNKNQLKSKFLSQFMAVGREVCPPAANCCRIYVGTWTPSPSSPFCLMRHVLQSCSLTLRTAPNDLPRFDLLLWPGSITNQKFGNTQKRPRWAKDCIAQQTHKLRTACSAERSGQGACTWSWLCCRFYFEALKMSKGWAIVPIKL